MNNSSRTNASLLEHSSRGATASLLEHPTSGEIKDVTKWAAEQARLEPGYLALRARLTARLSEMKPKEVSVDRVLITVLGTLEDYGVELNTANAMAAIDVRPGIMAGPELPFWQQWWRWLRTSFLNQPRPLLRPSRRPPENLGEPPQDEEAQDEGKPETPRAHIASAALKQRSGRAKNTAIAQEKKENNYGS